MIYLRSLLRLFWPKKLIIFLPGGAVTCDLPDTVLSQPVNPQVCDTTMQVGWVSVRWNILYTDRDRTHLQFTTREPHVTFYHSVAGTMQKQKNWLKKQQQTEAQNKWNVKNKKNSKKSPSETDGRLFPLFKRWLKTGMFSGYDSSVAGFSIPVHLHVQQIYSYFGFSAAPTRTLCWQQW